MRPLHMTLVILTGALGAARADAQAVTRESRAVDVGDGVALHYIEEGTGVPVIFVHGSLSDYEYWHAQLPEFAKKYRAIAYSRRYNYPNSNPPITGYSALTDARDLAGLIGKLRLGKVYVIGHSYGALTALLLATEHPELCGRWCWPSRPRSRCCAVCPTNRRVRARRCSRT
jgi:pimeloyl-ACP methyl ester carboxylesterase